MKSIFLQVTEHRNICSRDIVDRQVLYTARLKMAETSAIAQTENVDKVLQALGDESERVDDLLKKLEEELAASRALRALEAAKNVAVDSTTPAAGEPSNTPKPPECPEHQPAPRRRSLIGKRDSLERRASTEHHRRASVEIHSFDMGAMFGSQLLVANPVNPADQSRPTTSQQHRRPQPSVSRRQSASHLQLDSVPALPSPGGVYEFVDPNAKITPFMLKMSAENGRGGATMENIASPSGSDSARTLLTADPPSTPPCLSPVQPRMPYSPSSPHSPQQPLLSRKSMESPMVHGTATHGHDNHHFNHHALHHASSGGLTPTPLTHFSHLHKAPHHTNSSPSLLDHTNHLVHQQPHGASSGHSSCSITPQHSTTSVLRSPLYSNSQVPLSPEHSSPSMPSTTGVTLPTLTRRGSAELAREVMLAQHSRKSLESHKSTEQLYYHSGGHVNFDESSPLAVAGAAAAVANRPPSRRASLEGMPHNRLIVSGTMHII